MMPEALTGLRVLEYCASTAGAFCARLLPDPRADVPKVEPPPGDPARRAGPFPPANAAPETSGRFLYLNAGKHSRVLDPSSLAGREEFRRRLAAIDVLVEDGPPG